MAVKGGHLISKFLSEICTKQDRMPDFHYVITIYRLRAMVAMNILRSLRGGGGGIFWDTLYIDWFALANNIPISCYYPYVRLKPPV